MVLGQSAITNTYFPHIELSQVLNSCRESKALDFKERFDGHDLGAWCEVIKDFVAISNSGGGFIIIGLRNDGQPSGYDISDLIEIDQAVFTDKIASYTGEQFFDFSIIESQKNNSNVVVIRIGPSLIPLIFIRPGTYPVADRKQKTAFSQGTIYFRHGAKSETCNQADLRRVVEREIKNARKEWFGNMKKIVNAPSGYSIKVLPPEVKESLLADAMPIRIVNDPQAPAYRKLNADDVYPYRQVDVINFVNSRLGKKTRINFYDVLCIRKIYGIDKNEAYFHKPKFGSPQYSTAFQSWLREEFQNDRQSF